ncbi:MAG: peptide ABC transporter substrate-binding protein [Desulfobacterales bacterium]|nr:peptide ABC transporter substrate-binding protein [Desulfobacterales bacterium]
MQSKNYSRFALCLCVLLLLLTGYLNQPVSAEEKLIKSETSALLKSAGRHSGDDILRMLYWQAPVILNPHLSTAQKDHHVTRIFYEPLASFGNDGNLVPFLAADIPSLENGGLTDGKSVIWKLKKNVRWSDGEPFTAADVCFTYEFITNPEVGAASAIVYETVENVTALDDYTVKINFREVTPAWYLPFVGIYGMILPKHKFEAYNGSNALEAPVNMIPVSTGPYYVLPPGIKPQEVLLLGTELIQTIKVVMKPNPFFREKPYFGRIELRGGGTPDEASRMVLETGEVDYVWNLRFSVDKLTRQLKNKGPGQLIIKFGTSVDQIELNWTDPNKETKDGERLSLEFSHPFFNERRVRQAFAYAVDRKTIVNLYGPAGKTTNHIWCSPPYISDKIFYKFNLEKAKILLDEAGWIDTDGDGIRDKGGTKMKVLCRCYLGTTAQQNQQIIKKALESLGVDVELKIVDTSNYFGSEGSNPNYIGRFLADIQQGGWTAISPDPGLFLQYWTCEQIPQKSNNRTGFNFRRWCNSEYDSLYKQSRKELDPEKRKQIFIRMNDMLTEEVVTIPLVRMARISGISRDLGGFDPTPWDAETWNIKDWRRISQ